MRPLRHLLDANVLVDAHLRDLFLTLDHLGHVQVLWTDPILDEVSRALINKLGLDEMKVQRLLDTIASHFPAGRVTVIDRSAGSVQTPDPGDQHVLDAAIDGEADTIVTKDRRGFPDDEELYALDLDVIGPDEALQQIAEQSGIEAIASALAAISERLSNPRLSIDELVVSLEARAPNCARDVIIWLRTSTTGESAAVEIAKLMSEATDALNDMTRALDLLIEASDSFALLTRTETGRLNDAVRSGERRRRSQALLASGHRMAAARRQYVEGRRSFRAMHAVAWDRARTATHQWIELLPHSGHDRAVMLDMAERWMQSREQTVRSMETQQELVRLWEDEHSELSGRSRAEMSDHLRALRAELEDDAQYVIDLDLLCLQIGEIVHPQAPSA